MLSVAIPPLLWSVRQAHLQRVGPVMASKARWLAQEKLEDIIADRNSSTRGYTYVVQSNYPAEPTISGFPGFSRSVSLAETNADLTTPGSGYKKVTVTVTWTDASATSRSLAVTTVLTDY